MTRRREKDLNAKSNPVSPFVPRMDLSDLPERHRVTNATTTEPLSLVKEWAGFTARPGSMDAFSFQSKGQRC